MPSLRINTNNNSGFYFTTFTIRNWYYLFDRYNRWDILAKSLRYCIEDKGLQLYGYVFMLNHVHLLFYSASASGFIRDFKRHTATELKKSIELHEPHILKLFLDEDGVYTFWQKTNMPILIESEEVFRQKLEYVHNNPVRKGYVERPEYWYWSSANPASEVRVMAFG